MLGLGTIGTSASHVCLCDCACVTACAFVFVAWPDRRLTTCVVDVVWSVVWCCSCDAPSSCALVWVLVWQLATTPPPGQYVQLSCYMNECCAVRLDGVVVCWGGQLGEEEIPFMEFGDGDTFIQVAVGNQFVCGIKVRCGLCRCASTAQGTLYSRHVPCLTSWVCSVVAGNDAGQVLGSCQDPPVGTDQRGSRYARRWVRCSLSPALLVKETGET